MVGVSERADVVPVDVPAEEATVQPPDRDRNRWMLLEGLVCLITAIAIAALGAPIGLLWRAVAPRVELVQTQVGPYPLEAEPEGYVADEGWFMFLAIGAGVLFAVLAWVVLRRFRGPVMLVALVAGSIGGSVLAAWLGHRIGLPEYERLVREAPVGTHILRPVRVRLSDVGLSFGVLPRVRGIVLLQALVAAALYTAFAGFSYSPSLRPEPNLPMPMPMPMPLEPAMPPALDTPALDTPAPDMPAPNRAEPLSSDSPAPRDLEAAPAPPAPAAGAQSRDGAWRAQPEDG
jgi:hypothetical protein